MPDETHNPGAGTAGDVEIPPESATIHLYGSVNGHGTRNHHH